MQSLHLYGEDGAEWVVNPLAISYAASTSNGSKHTAVHLCSGVDLRVVMRLAAFEQEWDKALVALLPLKGLK